jgi:hypothetical protein
MGDVVTRPRAAGPGFESMQGQEIFLFENVQTGSGPHAARCSVGTGFISQR